MRIFYRLNCAPTQSSCVNDLTPGSSELFGNRVVADVIMTKSLGRP